MIINFEKTENKSTSIRFSIKNNDNEIGRAYLYLIYNDLHQNPYGLLEDVYVDDNSRGKGVGTKLINLVIEEAKLHGCYKLIGQSRYGRESVHELYKKIGFTDYGINFRMDF